MRSWSLDPFPHGRILLWTEATHRISPPSVGDGGLTPGGEFPRTLEPSQMHDVVACEGWRGAEAGGAQGGGGPGGAQRRQARALGDRGAAGREESASARTWAGGARAMGLGGRGRGGDSRERWADSWVGVTWLTVDIWHMRKRARAIETEQYGARATVTAQVVLSLRALPACGRGGGGSLALGDEVKGRIDLVSTYARR